MGAFGRTVSLRFRAELAEFRNNLMDDLSEKYMLKADAERRFEVLTSELKETRHALRNEMHLLGIEVRRERDEEWRRRGHEK